MIGRVKAVAKAHWPRLRLRTILLLTFIFVAALPGFGAIFLRVYENTLVRQTESELIAQGAAVAAAAEMAWGAPTIDHPLRPDEYRPEPPSIDLNAATILPERPRAVATTQPPSAASERLAAHLQPLLRRTSRTTLASIQLLDRQGNILAGADRGLAYPHVAEVARAIDGARPVTVLRHNGSYRQRYPLEWLSRASDIRIHHVRPVIVDGRVEGAVLLSRSPRALFRGLYQDRGKILVGIGVILATLIVLAGLLSRGIAKPIEQLSDATRRLAAGNGAVADPPQTAAVEIQALYRDFAEMAASIDLRSRYVRDFAHAVSHEFKTPLAGIRGVIELLEDHEGAMTPEERRRFLSNAAQDADRLSQLVSRLLDLARADMARPEPTKTEIQPVLQRVAAAQRVPGFAVEVEPDPLPTVTMPAEILETVVTGLVENSRQAGATRLTISASTQGADLAIILADDGSGIPPGDRARIFEPFFTSRRSEGGTGLGLPIARSLTEAGGGRLHLIDSMAGASFRLDLPKTP